MNILDHPIPGDLRWLVSAPRVAMLIAILILLAFLVRDGFRLRYWPYLLIIVPNVALAYYYANMVFFPPASKPQTGWTVFFNLSLLCTYLGAGILSGLARELMDELVEVRNRAECTEAKRRRATLSRWHKRRG